MARTTPPPTFDYEATIRDGAVRHALEGYEAQAVASLDDLQRQVDTLGLLGYWIDVPFKSGDFRGGGSMTWTPTASTQVRRRNALVGTTLFYDAIISGTDVSGGNADLLIALPQGFRCGKVDAFLGTFLYIEGGAFAYGSAFALSEASWIRLNKVNFANWSPAAKSTSVYVHVFLEVLPPVK